MTVTNDSDNRTSRVSAVQEALPCGRDEPGQSHLAVKMPWPAHFRVLVPGGRPSSSSASSNLTRRREYQDLLRSSGRSQVLRCAAVRDQDRGRRTSGKVLRRWLGRTSSRRADSLIHCGTKLPAAARRQRWAQKAVPNGAELVSLWGGDGTIQRSVNVIAGVGFDALAVRDANDTSSTTLGDSRTYGAGWRRRK